MQKIAKKGEKALIRKEINREQSHNKSRPRLRNVANSPAAKPRIPIGD